MPSVSFGPFTFDARTGRLRNGSVDVPLQSQPARVLAVLTAKPGELVTRDELRAQVWGDTWVNFDQGLNYCVRQIRIALDDDARSPRYVQTLPQRGYRFVASVAPPGPPHMPRPSRLRRWTLATAAAAFAIGVGAVLGLQGAAFLVEEQRRSGTSTDLTAHLQPIHVVRGTWTHHVKPALGSVFIAAPPQAGR
jgi:DNA-binding winged helix-turn-helix (wHTH) protein